MGKTGLNDEEFRKKIIVESSELSYRRLRLNQEEIYEMRKLREVDEDAHRVKLSRLKEINREREEREKKNAQRRKKRKETKELIAKYEAELKAIEEKKQKALEKRRASKNRYKNEKCASLQVFIDKELVSQFKELVEINNESQATVIKGFIESYISSYKTEME